MSVPARWSLLGIALSLAACSSSSKPDAGTGDAGQQQSVPDAGSGCANLGYACDPIENPCCLSTCDDGVTEYVGSVCSGNLCIPAIELDGGNPASVCNGPDGGMTTGGSSGIASADCAVWQVQTSLAGIAALNGVAVPSPYLQVAVGSGAGQGQLLVPVDAGPTQNGPDGGLYPPDGSYCPDYDAGPASTWVVYPSLPAVGTLNGVWADSAGDVFAVGQTVAQTGVLLAGNLDGGLVVIDGGTLTVSLTSVLGLGPAEALAGGFTAQGHAVVFHLVPDGGLLSESLPYQLANGFLLTQIDRIAGNDVGLIYALGRDSNNAGSQVLQRVDGGWTVLTPPNTGGLSSPALANLSVGPSGDLWVVGSNGSGTGLAFTYADGGFVEQDLSEFGTLPPLAPLTAVYETAAGELFIAAVPTPPNALFATPQIPQMLHRSSAGVWDYEMLPEETITLTAIAGDAAGDLFAVGGQEGVTLDPNPDAGGEASVPLVLQRLVP
jgi:hypothetical protein